MRTIIEYAKLFIAYGVTAIIALVPLILMVALIVQFRSSDYLVLIASACIVASVPITSFSMMLSAVVGHWFYVNWGKNGGEAR